MIKRNIIFLFVLLSYVSSFAQSTFKNVPVGGGGFVTGVISNKTTGDIYCRTDVGGAYRWDATSNKWVQLLNWITEAQSSYNGVESLAIDEQNPNNIYMLCGISYINDGATAILKSTDKGNSFTVVDVSSMFKANGNGYGRGNGERLAVDPNNSNILFCGTRANGLWKSTDGGSSWSLAWNGVTTTTNGNGICFVVFDPSSVSGGTTKTMYIGVSRTGSDNIYKSIDGGATFTAMSATTAYMPHRAILQGTTMYVTYADSEGPGTSGAGRVFKLNTSTSAWTNVTPLTWGTTSLSYGGVDIDPANVNRVVVSTTGNYNNNQYGTTWGDFVYFSTDGGSTWAVKNGYNSTFDNNGIGVASGQDNWAECAVFDPSNSNKVRVVGGGGIFACPDITATNPTWKYDVIGIEETAFLDGISIPGGPFVCAMGDMDGFLYNDITAYPTQFLQPSVGTNRSIAFAAGNTNILARSSDATPHAFYSTNKGATWTRFGTTKGLGGRLAISADGGTFLHAPDDSVTYSQLNTIYYSTDNGTTWAQSNGVAVWGAIPVADPVNSNYFYIYNPIDGKMYVSSDKGKNFSAAVSGNPGSTSVPWSTTLIRTVLGHEGHVWVPLADNGLRYSTDHGLTYTTIPNVTYCRAIGIGKEAPGATYPTLFIWGTVRGVKGLFRSTDKGASWIRINDDAHQYGGIQLIIGDNNVFGRAYLGAQGITYCEDTGVFTGINDSTTVFDFDGVTPSFGWGDTFVSTANPHLDAVNSSANVGLYTHTTQYNGPAISVDIDPAVYTSFEMMAYAPTAGTIAVGCYDASWNNLDYFSVNVTTPGTGWVKLTHHLGSFSTKIAYVVPLFNNGSATYGGTVYYDNLVFRKNHYEFTGATSNDPAVSTNWVGGLVPGSINDVTISGGTLVLDQNATYNSITVNPTAKLTLNDTKSLTLSGLLLKSDATGTATFVDKNTTPSAISASVQQYLPATDRSWYMSSPIASATSGNLNTGASVVEYNEQLGTWPTVSGTLASMKGYVSIAGSAGTGTLSFLGNLNSGSKSVTLSRKGSTSAGFNLVGNPYPSYLMWTEALATSANCLPTIWYRTKSAGAYAFQTYNASGDIGVPSSTSGYIPPMQAFWVRTSADVSTLTVDNAMRSHGNGSSNLLKAPSASKTTGQLVRLQVSNGSNSDETVIYSNQNADNGFDNYDSPKISSNNANIPEIFTTAGTEKLVINGMKTIPENTEIPLGLTVLNSASLKIVATQISNFVSGTQIVLIDKVTGNSQDLSNGREYIFDNSVPETGRFSLMFKVPSVYTAVGSANDDNSKILIFKNVNNQIVVNCDYLGKETTLSVYNAMGQILLDNRLTEKITIIDRNLKSGVYLVTVMNKGRKVTNRIVI